MAKVSNNIYDRGLSGSLADQFIIRKGRGGTTVITNKPTFASDRTFNEAQLAHQDAFRMAIAYAKRKSLPPSQLAGKAMPFMRNSGRKFLLARRDGEPPASWT